MWQKALQISKVLVHYMVYIKYTCLNESVLRCPSPDTIIFSRLQNFSKTVVDTNIYPTEQLNYSLIALRPQMFHALLLYVYFKHIWTPLSLMALTELHTLSKNYNSIVLFRSYTALLFISIHLRDTFAPETPPQCEPGVRAPLSSRSWEVCKGEKTMALQ